MGVSTLDCTSCGSCVSSCPKSGKALKMVPTHEVSLDQTGWKYLQTLSEKNDRIDKFTLKGSQLRQPLVEFNGACAGCGETPYIKLLTQLYGDKMYLANATGCTQAWGAAMPCVPYCKNKEGKGVAWSNSLFENNAEFSYGMCLAVKQLRAAVTEFVKQLDGMTKDAAVKAAIAKWLETYDDLDALLRGYPTSCWPCWRARPSPLRSRLWWPRSSSAARICPRRPCGCTAATAGPTTSATVVWIMCSPWARTSTSCWWIPRCTPTPAASPLRPLPWALWPSSRPAAKDHEEGPGLLMMTYDNVYVAQCSMGADPDQLIKAIKEAEAHKGPSIVICYAPCINHGIKKGMSNVQQEMKDAVNSGYWNLYRYSPETQKFTWTPRSRPCRCTTS